MGALFGARPVGAVTGEGQRFVSFQGGWGGRETNPAA